MKVNTICVCFKEGQFLFLKIILKSVLFMITLDIITVPSNNTELHYVVKQAKVVKNKP